MASIRGDEPRAESRIQNPESRRGLARIRRRQGYGGQGTQDAGGERRSFKNSAFMVAVFLSLSLAFSPSRSVARSGGSFCVLCPAFGSFIPSVAVPGSLFLYHPPASWPGSSPGRSS
jgi:hypothetical protein